MKASRFAQFVLIASLAPLAASAQHTSAPAKPAEVKPAPAESKPAQATPAKAKEPTPPAKPPRAAATGTSDIKAALACIDQEIAKGRSAPRPTRVVPKVPATSAPARIRLTWRSSLAWPVEIGGIGDNNSRSEASRITLNWP